MGEEKLDNAVYYIRGLYDYADMARAPGQRRRPARPRTRADALLARFEAEWWIEAEQQYADSLRDPGNVPIIQKHWIGVDPMEAELYRDGEFVPGLASHANGSRALVTRENGCYSGERPGNRGLFHTGCGGGPAGAGEFGIFSLGHRRPGHRRGQLRAPRRRAAAPLPRRERRDAVSAADHRRHAGRAARRDAGDHALARRPTARLARRRTSTAAGRAGRCSCRPGATTARRGP